MDISFRPICFDSLGAKSSCTLIETPDVKLLIDPGVAALQPSFPAPAEDKLLWKKKCEQAIKKTLREAEIVVVSHYHYDHYMREVNLYKGKTVLAKNPNEYINLSQRGRAVEFFNEIVKKFGAKELDELLEEPKSRRYPDPLEDLPIAMSMDFGDYKRRREELLRKGLERFRKLTAHWNGFERLPELKFKGIRVVFPEGKTFKFGDTLLRFTVPLFHGIEFSRVGWVFATVIEYKGSKIIHTSDLNGPVIEDYADWVIKENPDVLILDGPMTYMLGYMLNKINLKRTIQNAVRIIKNTKTRPILYDHHLPRERKFREHVKEVFKEAEDLNKRVLTVAEYLGKIPKVLEFDL